MGKEPKRKHVWASFKIDDEDSCARAIRNGGIAALVSAGITAVFAVAGFFSVSPDETLNYLLDPLVLLDVIFTVILAMFVFRRSRVAATVLVVYFTSSKLLMWYEVGAPRGIIVTVIFFMYYITALRGTYIWHSRYASVGPTADANAGQ